NLSGMSRRQAEDLLAGQEGRLCVHLYRRADGTVLTTDCPVGLAAVRRRMALTWGFVTAGGLTLVTLVGVSLGRSSERGTPNEGDPLTTLRRWCTARLWPQRPTPPTAPLPPLGAEVGVCLPPPEHPSDLPPPEPPDEGPDGPREPP